MSLCEVYFFGLICHISKDERNPDRKTHAALVKARGHVPAIIIDGGPPDLVKHDVIFSASATDVGVSSDLQTRLPHLSPPFVFGGTPAVNPDVVGHKGHPYVHGYVYYPMSTGASTLEIADVYPSEASYQDENGVEVAHFCPARLVVLSVEGEPSVDYGAGSKPIRNWVLIMNAGKGPMGAHWPQYKNITDAANITDVVQGSGVCVDVERHGEHRGEVLRHIPHVFRGIDDLECANSHWP